MFVTFLSDYGPGDEYVGVVEGVIASIAPDVRVIHLGARRAGAGRAHRCAAAGAGAPVLPRGGPLAVVDPGVGGARLALAIRCGARWLVGPDNGLLVPAAEWFGIDEVVEVSASPWRLGRVGHVPRP